MIKQYLRIKSFFGTSPNAVSIYVLVAIIEKELKLEQSLYTILQILGITLFDKEPLDQVLTDAQCQFLHHYPDNQLNL